MLLLHGSPMWSFMYRSVIHELRDSFRCVAVDLPGLGLSSAPLFRGEAFSRNADWLEAFVDKLDLRDVTLVLHATAGPSALEVAIRQPSRVRALVISNSFAWPLEGSRKLETIVSSQPFAFANVHLNLLGRLTARLGRRKKRFSDKEREAVVGPYLRLLVAGRDPAKRLRTDARRVHDRAYFRAARHEGQPLLRGLYAHREVPSPQLLRDGSGRLPFGPIHLRYRRRYEFLPVAARASTYSRHSSSAASGRRATRIRSAPSRSPSTRCSPSRAPFCAPASSGARSIPTRRSPSWTRSAAHHMGRPLWLRRGHQRKPRAREARRHGRALERPALGLARRPHVNSGDDDRGWPYRFRAELAVVNHFAIHAPSR